MTGKRLTQHRDRNQDAFLREERPQFFDGAGHPLACAIFRGAQAGGYFLVTLVLEEPQQNGVAIAGSQSRHGFVEERFCFIPG